jgi:hypothetical protein
MNVLETERIAAAAAPDSPAVGVHWRLGDRCGFIPAPAFAGKGKCWWCGETAVGAHPPLCNRCGATLWGDEVYVPSSIAAAARRRVSSWRRDGKAEALGGAE